jgi:hypothetical protein
MTPSEPTTNDLEPIEHVPENVVIHDRGQRPWTVHTATMGIVIVVRWRRDGAATQPPLVVRELPAGRELDGRRGPAP